MRSIATLLLETGEDIYRVKELRREVFFLARRFGLGRSEKITESGHQTEIISTDYQNGCSRVAPTMFAR